MLNDHPGLLNNTDTFNHGSWFFMFIPEIIILPKHQYCKGFQSPIWTSWSIIVFSHLIIRIFVTNGENMRIIKDIFFHPASYIPAKITLCFCLFFSTCNNINRPESTLSKPVCQRTAKAESLTGICKPVSKVTSKNLSSFQRLFSIIFIICQDRIKQTIEMHCK